MSDKPRLIDGIVLTKFDTIDDKVFYSDHFTIGAISFLWFREYLNAVW